MIGAHVRTSIGKEDEAISLYGVTSTPDNLLIDQNGIIIARDLRGEKLEEEIAALLKGKKSSPSK